MTEPEAGKTSTDTAAAAAAALVENADRLGLKWDLKPATVAKVDVVITVLCDGDTVNIMATSMVGTVAAGNRVYVLFVPPSGNFIVGFIGPRPLGQSIGSAYFTGGTTGTSSGSETLAAAWTATDTFIVQPKRVAKLTLVTGVTTNSAVVGALQVRVRESSSLSSNVLVFIQFLIAAGSSSFGLTAVGIGYCYNGANVPVSFLPRVTALRTLGTGNYSVSGDSTLPMTLTGVDIGATSDKELAAIMGIATAL
jgi:hypothetical protein